MATLLSVNNYHYYRGGAETVFLEHNRMFDEMGWRVMPFAMRHPKNIESEWSRYFVDEIEFGESYSTTGKLARAAKVIYSFEARRNLRRLFREARPDVCHAHNIYHHISPSILGLLHEQGIPTVMTLHDLKIACPAYNMLAFDGICERCKGGRVHNVLVHRCVKGSTALSGVVMVESLLHRLLGSYRNHVDRFVVPSRFYIEKLVEWGFPRTKFQYIPNFVAADRYTPGYSPGKSFVYFGRISPEKGLATLIRAVGEAGCALRIVGTGPQTEELRALANTLSAKVTFTGYLSGEALHEEVRRARAVVLPSEWYENAPMTVLEAYALGKPVIGARIGGIPEQILDGRTGFAFPSGDADSLAAVVRSVADLADSDVANLGRAGRRWVEEEFSASNYCDRTVELYRGLGIDVQSHSTTARTERKK
jgi:glycosyltransferase involved in cell wall biosynthesis